MCNTMDIIDRIIELADNLYTKRGIKAVSMDMLADKLGISKRTIYESFEGKDTLIVAVLTRRYSDYIEKIERCLVDCKFKQQNEIQQFVEIASISKALAKDISPVFYEDLRRYHHDVDISFFERFKQREDAILTDIFIAAQEKGFFDKNIKFDIVYTLFHDLISDKLKYVQNNKFTEKEIELNLIKPLILGIATPKGRKELAKCKQD